MAQGSKIPRLYGKLRQHWITVSESPWTLKGAIRLALVLLAVSFVCVGPLMRSEKYSWSSLDDWLLGLALAWPIMIATLILRAVDGYRRNTQALDLRHGRAKRRNLSIVRALGELSRHQSKGIPDETINKVRESVLSAISFKIADLINERDENKITVSLVDFSCVESHNNDNGKMRVVGRSTRERQTPVDYPREHLVAWAAIKDGRPKSAHDCWNDNRFERLERAYRSVVGIPVVRDGKAIAAISIDHPHQYRFLGLEDAVTMAVQPYIGVLLLTYLQDVVGFDCGFDPAHSRPKR